MKIIVNKIIEIYRNLGNRGRNETLIARKNSSNKPKSNKVVRNNHGFPQYLNEK